jgi:uncharacterized protein (DUF427 family)
MPRPTPIPPKPGQESVWDYPRPPRIEVVRKQCEVCFAGQTIAITLSPVRVCETSHPPTYYFPLDAVIPGAIDPTERRNYCEFKGWYRFYDVVRGDKVAPGAAWAYEEPNPGYELLKDHIAFYAGPMDVCLVDGDYVRPQPGRFYGGWITSDVVGPFKGVEGSEGW